MPTSIIQAGTTLQLMSTTGGLTTLDLPTNVTLRSDVPPRWATFGRYVILVNTPSQPLTIDAAGTVRLLTPKPPRLAPILTGPNAGGLSGVFRAKMTNVIRDSVGNIIAESDYGPFSTQLSIASKSILASNLDISPDQITDRQLYRTTDNGATYFLWQDVDGNVVTSIQDDLADAGLSIFAAPILGTPPRLTTVAEFRSRLFGTGDSDIDHLRFTESGIMYAWPEDNILTIPQVGSDQFGIVALAPRREALGVGRRNMLIQVTGSGAEVNGQLDFDVVILSKELGIESQETVKVFRDQAYFLWKDGVYRWGSDGITCISNGTNDRGNVRSWFVSGNYFNSDQYTHAFAQIDPDRPCYRLFLASAGNDTIDTWVEYNIDDGTWWGPHTTSLFAPKSAFSRLDDSLNEIPVVGGSTYVYTPQATRTDGAATAITFDAVGKRHDMEVPDQDKYFGELTMLGKAQANGTLNVVSRAGDLNQTQTQTQYYDMRRNRQRLGRLGRGKHLQLELTNAEIGKDVEIFGYECDPVNLIGRR